MPMNKRTESIRLKHLQDIYYEKLQGIAYEVYDEQLHNLIIRPEELDADIHLYFRHTQPSLQDFYSRYASQWEYFHEMNEASDAKFLQFLKNSAYPFSMKYHLVDLNVKYYLQRFNAISPRSKEWKALRTLFSTSGIRYSRTMSSTIRWNISSNSVRISTVFNWH